MLSEMSDQEKSVLMAKAMGWFVSEKYRDYTGAWFIMVHEDSDDWGWIETINALFLDLYDPSNMALAFKVHLWAHHSAELNSNYRYRNWCIRDSGMFFLEDAQRLWLDKVLELATETGIVEI